MANDVNVPDIEAQLKRVDDLAKTENRPVAELFADMVELYIKRRSLNADLHELAAEGMTHAKQLGYRPSTQSRAMDIVNKKRQELRVEDKRGSSEGHGRFEHLHIGTAVRREAPATARPRDEGRYSAFYQ